MYSYELTESARTYFTGFDINFGAVLGRKSVLFNKVSIRFQWF